MNIKVKDSEGNIFKMPANDFEDSILEIHYCTSYYQFVVQKCIEVDSRRFKYPVKNIIVPTNSPTPLDLIAVNSDENRMFDLKRCERR